MDVRPWQRFTEADRAEFWATLALKYTAGIGPRTIARLLKFFGSALTALENKNFWQDADVSMDKARLLSNEAWRDSATEEWKNAQFCGANILLWKHEAYPQKLRSLIDAPSVLYYKGNPSLLTAPCIAIVGSRKCSGEGVKIAGAMARDLSGAGVSIVSGMAQGIDRVAHMAALANLGKSIGVLGTGIDIYYPINNKDVYDNLRREGLLLSEFAPTTKPLASNFPIRNRIVSGLSIGVLVVEGRTNSGSLITARLALEQNREVYAIPGAATAVTSQGCHELIRQGAKPVFNAEDILCDLTHVLRTHIQERDQNSAQEKVYTKSSAVSVVSENSCTSQKERETVRQKNMLRRDDMAHFSEEERGDIKKILNLLHIKGNCHIDEFCVHLCKAVSHVNALLIEMELMLLIKKELGGFYSAMSADISSV